MHARALLLAAAAGGIASTASGQVVLNEIYENPPGSGSQFDARYEYIELYGRPGMDLTGYAIALLKGGSDPDGDGIPGPRPPGIDFGAEVGEIDEAFSLDGLSLGSNGFLVIHNTNPALSPPTFLPPFFPPETTVATFAQTHIPTIDTVGNLANDTSSTYVLVRRRPNHSIVGGVSVYGPGYAWRKDVQQDVDFNGRLDFGFETPVNYPVVAIDPPSQLDPYQMVDDVAWSHEQGKEYVRSGQDEISDTPGFNPDAISRLHYFGQNPQAGHRFNSSGVLVFTRRADEEWVYGDMLTDNPRISYDFSTNPLTTRTKGPTDPNGPLYDGSCNPDIDGACLPNPAGSFRFQDLDVTGFQLTPGGFNDSGSMGITQFRWVTGDFNFDGVVDQADLALIQAQVGSTLDDTILCTDSDGNPIVNPVTSQTYDCWKFQGRDFNALEAMRWMDPTDGPGGQNADEVTPEDVAAAAAIIPASRLCADSNNDGLVNGSDFGAWLSAFNTQNPIADVNQDGNVNGIDFGAWLSAFNQGLAGPTCNP